MDCLCEWPRGNLSRVSVGSLFPRRASRRALNFNARWTSCRILGSLFNEINPHPVTMSKIHHRLLSFIVSQSSLREICNSLKSYSSENWSTFRLSSCTVLNVLLGRDFMPRGGVRNPCTSFLCGCGDSVKTSVVSTDCTRRLLAVDEASFEEPDGKPLGLRDVLNFEPEDSCGKSCGKYTGWD